MMSKIATELMEMASAFEAAGDRVRAARARKAAADADRDWDRALGAVAAQTEKVA